MKPVADGLVADVDFACCLKFTPQDICGGYSVPNRYQDNKSVLLPGGGPGLSSVPSGLCHTSGVGRSVSQCLNDGVARYRTSVNFPLLLHHSTMPMPTLCQHR